MAKIDTQFKKGQRPSIKTEFAKGIVSHNKGTGLIGTKVCDSCNKEFSKRIKSKKIWSVVKYCSLQCSGTAHKGKEASTITKEKMRVAKIGKVSPHLGKKRPEVSGENNWKWISDRTKLAKYSNGNEYRNSPASREWSNVVRNRDKWTCRIADNNCDGKVVAHHILPWRDFPELRYEVNNGITLCHLHHPRKRNDEVRLSPYFQELVNSK